MELLNPLTTIRGDLRYMRKQPYLKALLDNNVDHLVVGDTTDMSFAVPYVFALPIGKRHRQGVLNIVLDGSTVEIGDDYWFVDPEITGVAFGASIVGSDVRLDIVTSGIGENPELYYRVFKTP